MNIPPVLVSGALALSLLAQPAFAKEDRSIVVQVSDLNLSNAQGRNTLELRIRNAAHAACAPFAQRPLQEQLDYRRCVDGAVEAAQPRVDALIAGNERITSFASR